MANGLSGRRALGLLVMLLLVAPRSAQFGPTHISPQDIRDYYGVTSLIRSGYTGEGVTVAVVADGVDSTFSSDVKGFDSYFGFPEANITYVRPFGPNGTNLPTPEPEWTADAELVHAMAPNARILMVLIGNHSAPSGFSYVIDGNAADIATTSDVAAIWGTGAKAEVESYDAEFAKSVAENITLISGSGDWGTNDTLPSSTGAIVWTNLPDAYSMPEFSQYVTSVGGTEFELDMNGLTGEKGWNFSSGMASNLFPQPTWQAGLGVPKNGFRDIPDVALDASCQTPLRFFWQGSIVVDCGTSFSAPLFAGIIADIEQAAGHRLGFLNPSLYRLASANPSAFHDITSGCSLVRSNSEITTGYCAGPGWDYITGLGSPNAVALLHYFAPNATASTSTSGTTASPIESTTCEQSGSACNGHGIEASSWWVIAGVIAVGLALVSMAVVASRRRSSPGIQGVAS